MRIALVVPHVFMHEDILPHVIFSPGRLAIALADGLVGLGHDVELYTPGPVATRAHNVTADLALFERELEARGDSYMDLLKKHPLTFITLARQVQAELVARAYGGDYDVVHVYANEEEVGLVMAGLAKPPVVLTHHDPFNFLVRYRSVMPKYRHLNWISLSLAQQRGMPADTNWVGNIYHGLDPQAFRPVDQPTGDYALYLGRIIEPKGVHLAIAAAREAGMKLVLAGKHYAGAKDRYWTERIEAELGPEVVYVGHIGDEARKCELLANARALIVPSTFEEPFGMVMIEALACGTPVVGWPAGAIPEVVRDGVTGFVTDDLADGLRRVGVIDRTACRADFEARFTLERMVREHVAVYESVARG
jgi:glycosyltransferase involved in cell wall biosynthesis